MELLAPVVLGCYSSFFRQCIEDDNDKVKCVLGLKFDIFWDSLWEKSVSVVTFW